MKYVAILLAGAFGSAFTVQVQAQCFSPGYHAYSRARTPRDSCAVVKPFQPGRLGGYVGLLNLLDHHGTYYFGMDLDAYYFLTPRWGSGLSGTFTGRMLANVAVPAAAYGEIGRPLLELFSATWSNSLLVADQPRWRLALLGGAGVGWVNLRDKDQQVPRRGSHGDCACTESKLLDTAWGPVTDMGLGVTYKLRGPDAPWLSVRGEYRQWYGSEPFGAPNQFSQDLLSVGLSVPDAPRRGR